MPKSSSRRSSGSQSSSGSLVFERRNYLLLLVGVVLVAVGFAIMRIDNQFEGFLSLYVSPLIILAGYLEIIYAILWRPKPTEEEAG